jgi:hypothetical protein
LCFLILEKDSLLIIFSVSKICTCFIPAFSKRTSKAISLGFPLNFTLRLLPGYLPDESPGYLPDVLPG